MTGKETLESLRNLIRDIGADHGARLRRALAVAAVPVAAGLATACYGAPYVVGDGQENCVNTWDDDDDGLADCLDPDCSPLEVCIGCLDGLDNDGNGLSDCSDASCTWAEACTGACDNGEDEDGDRLADCDDQDCAGSPACP